MKLLWPSNRRLVRQAWRAYESRLQSHPVATQVVTSASLWGFGDIAAQAVGGTGKEFDQRRCFWTAMFGAAFIGPVGHHWYLGLEKFCCRAFKKGSTRFLIGKVFLDSAILGPIYVAAYFGFSFMILQRGRWDDFKKRMERDFLPTVAAELVFWPAFQVWNFVKVPVKHQLLAVNMMCVVDAAFLSWAGHHNNWLEAVAAKVASLQTAQGVA